MKPRWFNSIVPFKIISAVASTLIVLLTISLGGTSREVSLVVSILTAGSLAGSIFFGSFVFKTEKKVNFFLLGFFGLVISSFLLFFAGDIILVLLGSFLFSFLTTATFFAALALISEKYKDINKMIGKFEEIGGWAWVCGLIFGFFITSLLGLKEIFLLLTIFSVVSFIYATWLLRERILYKLAQGILADFGLLTLVERGVEFVMKKQEFMVEKALMGLHSIVKGSFVPSFQIVQASLPKKNILLHLTFLLIFLSFGLVYSQTITLMKEKGLTDNLIFGFSVLASTMSALFYSRAGKVEDSNSMLKRNFCLRILMFLLLSFSVFLSGLPFMILLAIFFLLDGYSWSYIVILSNSLILRKSKTEMGINNFFRSLGYIIGSFFSGILIFHLGFSINFIVASIFLLTSILIFLKLKIEA